MFLSEVLAVLLPCLGSGVEFLDVVVERLEVGAGVEERLAKGAGVEERLVFVRVEERLVVEARGVEERLGAPAAVEERLLGEGFEGLGAGARCL